MTTTVAVRPEDAPLHASKLPCDDEAEEIVTLIGVVPVAGPPAILLAGPLVLFALLLAGPALLVLTLALLIVACAACVAVTGAVVAAPYLLIRRLGPHRVPRVRRRAPAARFVPVGSRRGPA